MCGFLDKNFQFSGRFLLLKSYKTNLKNSFKFLTLFYLIFRCVFTNIDPETAQRDPEEDPLKTLKKYRQFEKTGESPVMGIHLGIREFGKLKLGDPVFVEDQ